MRPTDQFLEAFSEQQPTGNQPGWLAALRRESFARFAAAGFPTTKEEAWKYTSLEPVTDVTYGAPRGDVAASVDLTGIAAHALPDCHRLVFVDGRLAPGLSALDALPAEVTLSPLSGPTTNAPSALRKLGRFAKADHPLVALNTALHHDGALLDIPAGVTLDAPVQILWLATGTPNIAVYPRTLVLAGKGSVAAVIETFAALGEARYLTNAVTELAVDEGATVEHVKVQVESRAAFHLGAIALHQAAAATVRQHVISLGARLARTEIDALLAGEGCDTSLFGLYGARDEQHVDHRTTLDHARPRGTSREIYKGILGGRATGVFSGKVLVREGAQRTDALQSNRALLLSPEATVNSMPQLEIFADDVRCSHGATSGSLDEEALHYLRSRGLDGDAARRALINAFAADVIGALHPASLRERVAGWVATHVAAT